jgi:hypothetical protein
MLQTWKKKTKEVMTLNTDILNFENRRWFLAYVEHDIFVSMYTFLFRLSV